MPSMKRLQRSYQIEEYTPCVLGDEDGKVVVELFVTPYSELCGEFFRNIYRNYKEKYINGNFVKCEIRVIAPATRNYLTLYSSEVQNFFSDEEVTQKMFAEYSQYLLDRYGKDNFIELVERCCKMDKNEGFNMKELLEIGGGDRDEFLECLKNGEYLPRVKYDTRLWYHMFPDGTDNILDELFYINGEAIKPDRLTPATKIMLGGALN